MSVFPNQCVHRTLFQHHWASCTKAAQRQMGNFLRGKKGRRGGGGGRKIWSGSRKSGRMCVFPCSFKERQSERYWDAEIFTDCEREREKKKNKRRAEKIQERTRQRGFALSPSLSLSLSFFPRLFLSVFSYFAFVNTLWRAYLFIVSW